MLEVFTKVFVFAFCAVQTVMIGANTIQSGISGIDTLFGLGVSFVGIIGLVMLAVDLRDYIEE